MSLFNQPFLTASNVISLIRLIMTLPIVWALSHRLDVTALCLCFVAAFSDWLDGFIARRTNTVSEWGKVIDPIADKVLVGAVVVTLMMAGRLPLWFVVVVMARDVVILLGGVFSKRYTPIVLPSLWIGKFAVSTIALVGITAIVHWDNARDYLIIISTLLMTLSLWQYGKRLHGIIRQAKKIA